jgi:hypothetical protein
MVGCSGDSAPPVLAIRSPIAERQKQLAPAESVTPRTIEPQPSVVFIPDTPDGTVRAVFQGLQDGHTEVVWDALPATYQRDLNEIVHLAANRLNPEAWRWAQKIAGKSARLAKASPFQNDFANADEPIEWNIRRLETVASLSDGLAKCGNEPLERSKTVDLGDVLRTNGRALLPIITDLVGLLDAGFPNALQQMLQVSVSLKEVAGDSAILEIENLQTNKTIMEFVRVEGKWIPRWLADEWAGAMETARKTIRGVLPSEIANENFGLPFQVLAAIDMQVDELLRQIEQPNTDGTPLSDFSSNGYQAVMLLGYWFGGPPTIEPDFQNKTRKESLSARDKTTLVCCYADKARKFDNESVDRALAKHVASRLSAHKIKVVDPDQVDDWLGKNQRRKKPSEIGAAFKCDYIVHIDLMDFSVLEGQSTSLNRGRAGCIVNVIKMDADTTDGDVIYTRLIKSIFPSRGAIDSSAMPASEFKKRYLSFLSDEIGRLFYSP